MSAKLLLGKPVAEHIRQLIAEQSNGLCKKLCLIGFDEPHWNQYAQSLLKSAVSYGFGCENVTLDANVSPDVFNATVDKASNRQDVCGVMLQQPLPATYKSAVQRVAVSKDVDCLNPLSVCRLYNGEDGFRPATPQAVINLLDYYGIELKGCNAVVIGRGSAVGKPLAIMLLQRNATVTVCHTKTVNLPSICKRADLIVSACGVAGLVTNEFVTDRSVVVDVGLSFVNGSTRGDVASEVYDKCLAVSPVPGGVGPVTRATLFQNLLKACKDLQ